LIIILAGEIIVHLRTLQSKKINIFSQRVLQKLMIFSVVAF